MEDNISKTNVANVENNPKTNLLGLTKAEIKSLLNKINLPNFGVGHSTLFPKNQPAHFFLFLLLTSSSQ